MSTARGGVVHGVSTTRVWNGCAVRGSGVSSQVMGDAKAGDRSVFEALEAFDRAFAAGDAFGLTDMFALDARLLLQFGAELSGREAILGQWTRLFERFDTSAWKTEREIVDVHGAAAYTLSTYSETLVPREPGPSQGVLGRLVRFWRRCGGVAGDAGDELARSSCRGASGVGPSVLMIAA